MSLTPEQQKAAEASMRQWQTDELVYQSDEESERTFSDDVRSYQEGRFDEIEPGLREDTSYMAQLAMGVLPQGE